MDRYCHGIDFKNPFTMSKRGQIPHIDGRGRQTDVFISGKSRAARRCRCEPGVLCALGGAYRDRTDDLMLAKQPLSQLS